MMGVSHAFSGAAGALLLAPTIAPNAHNGALLAAALVAAGAALLPDIDHPSSTISRSLGSITQFLSNLVALLAGGHRGASHSLVGALVALAALTALQELQPRALLVLLGLLIILGIGALGLGARDQLLLGGAGAAALIVLAGAASPLLPAAVAIGMVAHALGDMVTKEPVALLWPLPWRISLGLFATNGLIERYLVLPALALSTAVLALIQGGAL